MKEMTSRQREVLTFIRGFTERNSAPPTVREIGERFGFTARAAFDHLRALERKGMLQRRVTDKRVSRTLVLTQRSGAGRRLHVPQCGLRGGRVVRIDEHSHATGCRHQLTQEFQALCSELSVEGVDSCCVASRPGEARGKTKPDWVFAGNENDGHCRGCRLGSHRRDRIQSGDHGDRTMN